VGVKKFIGNKLSKINLPGAKNASHPAPSMNDEHYLPTSSEDERIDTRDSWQVLWWCRTLNITKTQLEDAINAVGNEPGDVKRYLTPETQ
jgi:hypothetical protein